MSIALKMDKQQYIHAVERITVLTERLVNSRFQLIPDDIMKCSNYIDSVLAALKADQIELDMLHDACDQYERENDISWK